MTMVVTFPKQDAAAFNSNSAIIPTGTSPKVTALFNKITEDASWVYSSITTSPFESVSSSMCARLGPLYVNWVKEEQRPSMCTSIHVTDSVMPHPWVYDLIQCCSALTTLKLPPSTTDTQLGLVIDALQGHKGAARAKILDLTDCRYISRGSIERTHHNKNFRTLIPDSRSSITPPDLNEAQEKFNEALKRCRQHTSLETLHSGIDWALEVGVGPACKRLELPGDATRRKYSLESLRYCTNLEELILPSWITDEDIKTVIKELKIANAFDKLKCLNLANCEKITPESLVLLGDHCLYLEQLILPREGVPGLETFDPNKPNLTDDEWDLRDIWRFLEISKP